MNRWLIDMLTQIASVHSGTRHARCGVMNQSHVWNRVELGW